MQTHWFIKVLFIFSVFFLVALVILALPRILPTERVANTSIHGIIFLNQIWEGNVKIDGDIFAIPATHVFIKPGATVSVAKKGDKFNLDFVPWHLKSGVNSGEFNHGINHGEPFWDEKDKIQIHFGKLTAVGSKEMPIRFKSEGLNGSPYDFNTIQVESGVISGTVLKNYRRLEIGKQVTVRDSIFSEIGECAICIRGGDPSVINNYFSDIHREAIWVYKASPRITDNLFTNLSGEGIKIDPKRNGVPVISFNTFEMPGKFAIDILSGGEINSGVISFNKLSGNSKINIACDSKIRITQNVLASLIYFGGSGCGGMYTFGPNYWPSRDLKTIMSEQITNKDRKFKVLITSLLDSPPKIAGVRR